MQADANQPEPARTVTYLYTDIEGSTRLWEQMPVAMQASQALHHSILRAGTESHHGHVFQIRDDAFCASFWTVIDGIMI